MKEENVFFQAGGIRLEGLLSVHEAFLFRRGIILCHPHPQFGGDMNNYVITTAAETAHEEGFSTLRFNFRGVGRSEGSYGEGVREKEDVRGAIDFLSAKQEEDDGLLVLLGYSFGAWAGLPVAAQDDRVKGLIAVAPPLDMMDFDFLKGCKKRKLILVGNKDLFCPPPLLEKWFQTLEEPKSLAVVEGADHFFSFHRKHLVQPLKEFLEKF